MPSGKIIYLTVLSKLNCLIFDCLVQNSLSQLVQTLFSAGQDGQNIGSIKVPDHEQRSPTSPTHLSRSRNNPGSRHDQRLSFQFCLPADTEPDPSEAGGLRGSGEGQEEQRQHLPLRAFRAGGSRKPDCRTGQTPVADSSG